MNQTMFPLIIMNILENHATRAKPLTITEITNLVNREFEPFAFEKKQLMNRTTVMRILDAMELWTEGNLFNFHLVQWGGEKEVFSGEKGLTEGSGGRKEKKGKLPAE